MSNMAYGVSCVSFLASVAMIVLGVTLVRKAVPKAGYLFAAAGAVNLLATCCGNALSIHAQNEAQTGYDYEGVANIHLASSVLGTLGWLLVVILLAVGFVMLAKGNQGSRVQ